MEIRDRQTLDAVADVATILATAYQRYRRARRIEIDRRRCFENRQRRT